ncbi:MAG: filamentous hemagglutinin N-terminal domain-containing protein [Candidatus Marithrix sp.]
MLKLINLNSYAKLQIDKNSRLTGWCKVNLVLSIILFHCSVTAEIITDGSLGQSINLPGPDFQITSELGQLHGNNLFHSFQDFNLQSHESAIFSGSNEINNVISRVTGDNPSNIDGLIRSTIPNANFYFLNPHGIIFGSNAKLDIQGSFHASTANYLRLGDKKFQVDLAKDSSLSIAPIEAFGFLTEPQSITTQDSQLVVPYGKTLSLIGGNLELTGQSEIIQDDKMAITASSWLSAQGGRINLASVVSKGEVILNKTGIELNMTGGKITTTNSLFDVSGAGSGSIFIRGEQFIMNDSVLQANTLAEQNGQLINIKMNKKVNISGNSGKSAISTKTFGSGNAGDLTINTPILNIDKIYVQTDTLADGDAGNININTVNMVITDGGQIVSDSFGNGNGGELNITATESLAIIDKRIFFDPELAEFNSNIGTGSLDKGNGGKLIINTGQLTIDGSAISLNSHSSGNAGEFLVNADSIDLINGGLISTNTMSKSSGQGGNITLNVKNKIYLTGFRIGLVITSTDMFENVQSAIASITFGSGDAGNINLSAKELILDNNASIGAATGGLGNAGNITIYVDSLQLDNGGVISDSSGGVIGGQVFLGFGAGGKLKINANKEIVITGKSAFSTSGLLTNTLVSAPGGNIEIQTDKLTLSDEATISANSLGIGNAGTLDIKANTINLLNGGNITTSSTNAAGGNIDLTTAKLLFLQDGQITTSVGIGAGKGGDINITNPIFIVMDGGKIKAQADSGHGGNINISSNQFIASPDSLISASSRLGIDGQIRIDSPDMDVDGFLVILPGGFVEANMKSCNAKDIDSSFKFIPRHRTAPFNN